MAGVRRDLWRSSSPTPLPKQVHLEQAARLCFEIQQQKSARKFHCHGSRTACTTMTANEGQQETVKSAALGRSQQDLWKDGLASEGS